MCKFAGETDYFRRDKVKKVGRPNRVEWTLEVELQANNKWRKSV